MLDELVSPLGGLIGRCGFLRTPERAPHVWLAFAELGDLDRVLPRLPDGWRPAWADDGVIGLGLGRDASSARIRALAEAVERHAACVYDDNELVWASADELGDRALDLARVPRCSAAELAHPDCPIGVADPAAPIRWVRGLSLVTGRIVWIPAVMVFLRYACSDAERFYLPMSTGCAAHPDLRQALVNACYEIVERDAATLTWLARLPLPEIDLARERAGGPSREILRAVPRLRCFDATTELGVPAVYGVEVDDADPAFTTLVTCASDPDPRRALEKVACEALAYRPILAAERSIPDDPGELRQGVECARYMGAASRRHAFSFLLDQEPRVGVDDLARPGDGLDEIVSLLARHDVDVIAVDLTTREARRAGMRVVRVVMPELMPMTFRLRVRYAGHPRLARATRAMGHAPRTETELSPWPQPIA